MKNSLAKTLYHSFLVRNFKIKRFRGGWMLTQMFVNDWKQHWKKHPFDIVKAHYKGWSYNDWMILGVTNKTKDKYLSSVKYCSLHPFSGSESFWIDDKLTLKYILYGTLVSEYMPKYYYQIESSGNVLKLMDAPADYPASFEGLIRLLDKEGALGLKKIKASLGDGFYSIQKSAAGYFVNEEKYSEEKLKDLLSSLSGYLVMELLRPHPYFAKYNTSAVGCLRYIIGRKLDGSIIDIYSFMRIGTRKSGSVENFNRGGVLLVVNENGEFNSGYILDNDSWTSSHITNHPDNGIILKGKIPNWNEIKSTSRLLAETLPQLNYMGIDYVITRDGEIKILEINSLSSLDAIQLDKSIFETKGGIFFKERLER